jgi:transposase
MPKTIVLEAHLTKEELHQRYRACSKPNEKLRWKALYLIASGKRAADAARRVGRSSAWVSKVTARYNVRGARAVADKAAATARGTAPTLNPALALELDAALHQSAPDGGLWTANKVAEWILAKTGRRLHESSAWRILRSLGFTVQTARPQHAAAATAAEQTGWKKN